MRLRYVKKGQRGKKQKKLINRAYVNPFLFDPSEIIHIFQQQSFS